VATRYREWACDRSIAGIVGSDPLADMDVCLFECCVLSGKGLCVGLITYPEEFYLVCCVCDNEASRTSLTLQELLRHGEENV